MLFRKAGLIMDFEKILIAGKDYIYFPSGDKVDLLSKEELIYLCDRRKGIGGDGIFTFAKNTPKTRQIQAFLQNGELMRDLSSIEICAVFSSFLNPLTAKYEIEEVFGKKIRIFGEENISEASFSREFDDTDTDDYTLKKTEIGNRILTLTKIKLHGTHTVHFTECIDSLSIDYFGRHISVNSFFGKKADISIAQKISNNTFLVKHYENNSGSPYPTVSALAAVALSACKTGYARYNEEIHIICNDTDIYAFCNKNNSCVIQGKIKRIFTGKS